MVERTKRRRLRLGEQPIGDRSVRARRLDPLHVDSHVTAVRDCEDGDAARAGEVETQPPGARELGLAVRPVYERQRFRARIEITGEHASHEGARVASVTDAQTPDVDVPHVPASRSTCASTLPRASACGCWKIV